MLYRATRAVTRAAQGMRPSVLAAQAMPKQCASATITRQVSYGQLLQIFFSVVHDPTQLNRQGPDTGSQYRSAIFPVDAVQEKVARSYIAQLDGAKVFKGPMVTRIEPGKVFYPAEAYHQDYLVKHPDQPYIVVHDLPKVEQLKKVFPGVYRAQPVLVSSAM